MLYWRHGMILKEGIEPAEKFHSLKTPLPMTRIFLHIPLAYSFAILLHFLHIPLAYSFYGPSYLHFSTLAQEAELGFEEKIKSVTHFTGSGERWYRTANVAKNCGKKLLPSNTGWLLSKHSKKASFEISCLPSDVSLFFFLCLQVFYAYSLFS